MLTSLFPTPSARNMICKEGFTMPLHQKAGCTCTDCIVLRLKQDTVDKMSKVSKAYFFMEKSFAFLFRCKIMLWSYSLQAHEDKI